MKTVIDLVAGARPNFVKLPPIVPTLTANDAVEDGSHGAALRQGHDQAVLEELGIPSPDAHLEVGSGSHGVQTAKSLERYEAHLLEPRPTATVVLGDVNSTVVCALAAVKLGIPVAHVEAGLRSFNRSMPEEINHLLTDAVSDLLFVSEPSGLANLRREGVPEEKVRFVGNVMIDSLLAHLPAAGARRTACRLGLKDGEYGFITLHRPSKVDDPEMLGRLLVLLHELAEALAMVFPVHPRTSVAAKRAGLADWIAPGQPGLICMGPLSSLDTISLVAGAAVVLTDSGGL